MIEAHVAGLFCRWWLQIPSIRLAALPNVSYMYDMLSIRLSKRMEERLEKVARMTGRTKSFYARQAIEEKIEEMEDLAVAIERLEHPGKTQTLAEVEEELKG